MIENIIEIAIGIVTSLVDSDGNFQCDMDCKHCPFPECSDEEKERMRKL